MASQKFRKITATSSLSLIVLSMLTSCGNNSKSAPQKSSEITVVSIDKELAEKVPQTPTEVKALLFEYGECIIQTIPEAGVAVQFDPEIGYIGDWELAATDDKTMEKVNQRSQECEQSSGFQTRTDAYMRENPLTPQEEHKKLEETFICIETQNPTYSASLQKNSPQSFDDIYETIQSLPSQEREQAFTINECIRDVQGEWITFGNVSLLEDTLTEEKS